MYKINKFDKIKGFYRSSEGGKQFSYYLPTELQKQLKKHATMEDKSISKVLEDLLLDHYLTDQEIKQAYNEGYDKRNLFK